MNTKLSINPEMEKQYEEDLRTEYSEQQRREEAEGKEQLEFYSWDL